MGLLVLVCQFNPKGSGELSLQGRTGREKVKLDAFGNAGLLILRGVNQRPNIRLGNLPNDLNKGRMLLYDNGNIRTALYVNPDGDGVLELQGKQGNSNHAVIGAMTHRKNFLPEP